MKKKILITGGSGFLGYHLIKDALDRDLEVYAGIRSTSNVEHLKDLPITLVSLNLSSKETLKEGIEKNKYDYIIHAAGATKAANLQQYNTVNSGFTCNLANAVRESTVSIKKFVFISSLAALGPLNEVSEVIDEESDPHPVTDYGRSKLLAERELARIDLPVVVLRPTAIYGPREKELLVLFKSISRGFDPYIGRVDQRLSFVYGPDVADAAMLALDCDTNTAFNLTDGISYSRYSLADAIKTSLGKKAFRFHIPLSLVKVIAGLSEKMGKVSGKAVMLNRDKLYELTAVNWICDSSKSKDILHFQPKYNLNEGIAATVKWYQREEWL